MQHELMLPQAVAKGLLELELLDAGQVQRGVVEAELAAAGLLGRVHRRIGVTNQAVDVLGIARTDGDTDAGAGIQLATLQRIRRRDTLDQRGGPIGDLLFATLTGQQHDEFIATETRRQVSGLQQTLNPPGDCLEQLITGLVAQGVVDRLEAVHVHEQDRQQAACAPLLGEHRAGELEKLATVVQTAQVVRRSGSAAAFVLVLQAGDQLLLALLGLLQRNQHPLLLAQHANQPEHHA